MHTVLHSVPQTIQQATADPRDSWTPTGSLGQSLVGSLLLFPGSWCTQGFVCALQEFLSPVLCKFVIKSHWPPKSNSVQVLSPFARSPCWEICCGSQNFLNKQYAKRCPGIKTSKVEEVLNMNAFKNSQTLIFYKQSHSCFPLYYFLVLKWSCAASFGSYYSSLAWIETMIKICWKGKTQ